MTKLVPGAMFFPENVFSLDFIFYFFYFYFFLNFEKVSILFFKIYLFNLFIFGCVGSSLLHVGFL